MVWDDEENVNAVWIVQKSQLGSTESQQAPTFHPNPKSSSTSQTYQTTIHTIHKRQVPGLGPPPPLTPTTHSPPPTFPTQPYLLIFEVKRELIVGGGGV